jgi:hypothetical protein
MEQLFFYYTCSWFLIVYDGTRALSLFSNNTPFPWMKYLIKYLKICNRPNIHFTRFLYTFEAQRETDLETAHFLNSFRVALIYVQGILIKVTLTLSIFPVCVVNYISVYKSGRLRTLFFWWFLYSSLGFETTTCFGCSLIQPSSGGDKTKELVTQVF